MQRWNLDVASGWPIRPVAAAAHADALRICDGDPERSHTAGRQARSLLDAATATVTHLLGAASNDLIWTSGGTEAIDLAVAGPVRAMRDRGGHRRGLVVSAVEHSAVLTAARRLADDGLVDLTIIGVDQAGVVDLDAMINAIDERTVAVHLQHANHEVGTLQPTHEVSRRCRSVDALLHVDACQTVGQVGVTLSQLGADLLSFSSAKHGGLRGVGGLALGPRARLSPQLLGDDRQRGRRAGSLSVAAIAASAVALDEAVATMDTDRSQRELVRRHLRTQIAAIDDVALHGPLAEAHPGIVAASALYVAGDALVARLDGRGWEVASGSSCAVRSGTASHVLVAMRALTHGHVRASFGPDIDIPTADAFVADLTEVIAELRADGRTSSTT
jgi:cysteine desulfurase